MVESINSLFMAEVIHPCGPGLSFEAVEVAAHERVDCHNTRRLLELFGNVPPAEAEARDFRQTEVQALAAWAIPNGHRKLRAFHLGM